MCHAQAASVVAIRESLSTSGQLMRGQPVPARTSRNAHVSWTSRPPTTDPRWPSCSVPRELNELGPGTPDAAMRPALDRLTPESLVAPHAAGRSRDGAGLPGRACGCDTIFSTSRTRSARRSRIRPAAIGTRSCIAASPTSAMPSIGFAGSGDHPVFRPLATALRSWRPSIGRPAGSRVLREPEWDPARFVDLCEQCRWMTHRHRPRCAGKCNSASGNCCSTIATGGRRAVERAVSQSGCRSARNARIFGPPPTRVDWPPTKGYERVRSRMLGWGLAMTFQFLCPQGHLLQGDEAHMGMQCQCPQCGTAFIIPTVGPAGPDGRRNRRRRRSP